MHALIFTDLVLFLSTLSLRRATRGHQQNRFPPRFLSTLSLRRATVASVLAVSRARYFYPRSPCGERHRVKVYNKEFRAISIHALLAESDDTLSILIIGFLEFLSTLSLRRATYFGLFFRRYAAISIHALLAESDHGT